MPLTLCYILRKRINSNYISCFVILYGIIPFANFYITLLVNHPAVYLIRGPLPAKCFIYLFESRFMLVFMNKTLKKTGLPHDLFCAPPKQVFCFFRPSQYLLIFTPYYFSQIVCSVSRRNCREFICIFFLVLQKCCYIMSHSHFGSTALIIKNLRSKLNLLFLTFLGLEKPDFIR